MHFSLMNPPASPAQPPRPFNTDYVRVTPVRVVSQGSPVSRQINRLSIPAGAVLATVILNRQTRGDAYFCVYLTEETFDTYQAFVFNIIPRLAGRYTVSFILPPGSRTLFFDWGGRAHTDELRVAFI